MHNSLHTSRIFLLSLLLVFGNHNTAAGAPHLYDVEIIIFSHNSQVEPDESRYVADSNAGSVQRSFPARQFSGLSSSHYKLSKTKHALQTSAGYTVLDHRAWRQPAYSLSNAVEYPVNSYSEASRNGIEGSIRLVRGRYLHLDVKLLLLKSSDSIPGGYSGGTGNISAYRIAEKRRIKSRELHYFDHPQFGVLTLVTPYSPPEQAVVEPVAPGPEPGNDSAPVPAKTPASQQ